MIEAKLVELNAAVAAIRTNEAQLAEVCRTLAAAVDGPRAGRTRARLEALMRPVPVIRSHLNRQVDLAERLLRDPPARNRPDASGNALRAWEALHAEVAKARRRLLMWTQIQQPLGEMTGWRRQELVPFARPRHMTAADQAARNLESTLLALHDVVNPEPQHGDVEAAGAFADIPMPPHLFANLALGAWRVAQSLQRRADLRFLDVGCGGGLRIVQAAFLFGRADGLEYDPGYAAVARSVLDRAGLSESRVHEGDARTFDGYGDYDVVYFYRPMRDPDALHDLEERILAGVRPGTILLTPYQAFAPRPHMATLDPFLHVAGRPQSEADAIRREAETIGLRVRDRPRFRDPVAGYLTPLLDALERTGFAAVAEGRRTY